jgi:hypothetical protein
MVEHDEKRGYARMEVDCDIIYKPADSSEYYRGRCTSISGADVSFISDRPFDPGKAMEINVVPKNTIMPPMTAFIEVVRSTKRENDHYEIAATIKSIKGD